MKLIIHIDGEDIGKAMLWATVGNIRGHVIENAEIRAIADHGSGRLGQS